MYDAKVEEAVTELVVKVQTMVAESGNPEGFDVERWVRAWLRTPLPALGGKRPEEFLSDLQDRAIVAQLLSMSQSGAYA